MAITKYSAERSRRAGFLTYAVLAGTLLALTDSSYPAIYLVAAVCALLGAAAIIPVRGVG